MTFKQKIKILLFLLNAVVGIIAACIMCYYIAKTSSFQHTSEVSTYADKLLTTSYYAILILLVIVYFALSFVGFLCVFFHCKSTNQNQIAFGILMFICVVLVFCKIQNSSDIITGYAYNYYSGLDSKSKDAVSDTLKHWVKGWLYTRCFDFITLALSIFSATSFLWLLLLENKSELMTSGINDPIMR